MAELAKEAVLSRSAFFDRLNHTVGVAPMAYLLAWRMATAKNLLRRKEGGIAEIAERVKRDFPSLSASRAMMVMLINRHSKRKSP